MTWTLTLNYPRPPKGLSANDRAHWAVKSKATAEVRELVKMHARSQRIPTMQRMQVELVWVVADRRRRDGGENLGPLLKAVVDGLAADKGTSAHLVPDDAPEFVTRLMPRIEFRQGETPYFEVIITDTSHRPDPVEELAKERLT